jgi:hypothetical protein
MPSAALQEFEVDPAAVRHAARQRLLLRFTAVAGLTALVGAAVNFWLAPERGAMAWSFAFTILAVYAAVEVSALQWARRSAPTMVLRLTAEAIELWIGSGHHRMPYRDLKIHRVRWSGNRVRSIELRDRQRGRVRLSGFRRMDELAEQLTARMAQTRADA